MGHGYPGQMRSFTWKYASARRRAFNSSIASFLCDLYIGALAVIHDFYQFCKGASSSGSRWPDVVVSVRCKRHAGPTLWLMGVERQVAVKSWNSLSACFYGLVSSIQTEKFFTPMIFFMSNSFQAYTTPSLYLVYLLFIKNRMILE